MQHLSAVPTCQLDTPVGDLRELVGDEPFVLAVDDREVVLGKVLARSIDAARDDEAARDHLIEGPTTVRADEHIHDLQERMERADTRSVIVTTPEGRLLGVFRLEHLPGR